jgi:GNAT superfamily N-acetyltransferase
MATRTRKIFNPVKGKEAALPPHYRLNTQYDPKNPLGNVGICNIAHAIRSWLIGFTYYDEALPRWIDWIDKALERDEEFGMSKEFYHLQLYQAKAIGKWLMNGKDDIKDWDNARIALEVRYYRQGSVHGNRVAHVMEHTIVDVSKPVHSVFSVPCDQALGLIDEAWATRHGVGTLQANGNRVWVVDMGRQVGTNGQTSIQIVVRDGTAEIITAFPK